MEWIHSRKGKISGEIVEEGDDWVDIQLDEDQKLRYLSMDKKGSTDRKGEVLRCRKDMLTLVPEPVPHDHRKLVKEAKRRGNSVLPDPRP